ncbi:endospore germination permease [Paenibacillus solisilvae]|uniref:Endospore germination permease n=1 Tax=Paenibacillus solisilvae TaxID=2486751 RepID=A0ABW0VUX8_9BACL
MEGQMGMTSRQFFICIFLFTIGTAILAVPSSIAAEARQNAWQPPVIGIGVGMVMVLLYVSVSKNGGAKTLFEINESVLGRWIGWVVNMFLTFSILMFCAQLLFYLGNFVLTQFMPETPLISISLLFGSVGIMAVRSGLQTLVRSAELFFPWFCFFLALLIVLSIPQVKTDNLLPLFEADMPGILRSAYTFDSYTFLPLIFILFILSSSIIRPKSAYRNMYLASALGGLVLILIILLSIGVLGAKESAMDLYPSYELAKAINIAGFLQRIEAIMAFIWFISVYIKMAFFLHCTVQGMKHLFRLKHPRAMALPAGWIAIVLSTVVYPNAMYMKDWDSRVWSAFSLVLGIVYPLILLAIAIVRRKIAQSRGTVQDQE